MWMENSISGRFRRDCKELLDYIDAQHFLQDNS